MGSLPQPRGVIDRPILELLTLGKKRLKTLKTIIFLNYSGFGMSLLLKTYWARRLCWPPAGKLWISGIQNFETLISLISVSISAKGPKKANKNIDF